MPYDPSTHNRKSIRLPGYDYSSPGAYFVTIKAHHRMHVSGETCPREAPGFPGVWEPG
jgi:putative transposase